MPSFTWQSLIDRARVYVDDDHRDEDSWITPAQWMLLFQVEYAAQYRRWVRMGLVTPAISQMTLTGPTTAVSGVLALVGVGQDLGDSVRVLEPAQSTIGRNAFWRGSTDPTGTSEYWSATGAGGGVSVELYPREGTQITSGVGSYVVRYIPTVAYATDATTSVDLPDGMDERLVLGAARRAHLKESAASRLLQQLITEADAELGFASFARLGPAPRVRRHSRYARTQRFGSVFPATPADWLFI